jgi:hypothetical protein
MLSRKLIMLLMAMSALGLKGGDELDRYGSDGDTEAYLEVFGRISRLEVLDMPVPEALKAEMAEQRRLKKLREEEELKQWKAEQRAKEEADREARIEAEILRLKEERQAEHKARRPSRKSLGSPVLPISPIKE